MSQPSVTPAGLLDLMRRRIAVAPMAGGPTTVDLVIAAAQAGAPGFLAGGYKTPRGDDGRDRRRAGRDGRAVRRQRIRPGPSLPGRRGAGQVPGLARPRPLRAAAAASGDTESMSLRAGQGYRLAADLPAAQIIHRLRS